MAEACVAASGMVEAVTRASEIIDRVRSLYRRGPPLLEPVQLNEIVREMTVLLRQTANRGSISLRTALDPGLPATTADRVLLQQVLMNLMINGIEAMGDTGGELTVTSKRSDDGQLLISVTDSGIGLPDDSRAHFRGLLHHQAARHRHGTVDQPADRRIAWRPLVGEPQHRKGCDFSIHAAGDVTGGPHPAGTPQRVRYCEA